MRVCIHFGRQNAPKMVEKSILNLSLLLRSAMSDFLECQVDVYAFFWCNLFSCDHSFSLWNTIRSKVVSFCEASLRGRPYIAFSTHKWSNKKTNKTWSNSCRKSDQKAAPEGDRIWFDFRAQISKNIDPIISQISVPEGWGTLGETPFQAFWKIHEIELSPTRELDVRLLR